MLDAAAKRQGPVRVLLAEDDPSLARQIAAALGRAGYAVDKTGDGEEAWFLGDTEPYDAIVLDLGLPALDGLALLRRWRSASRTMPVLILTGRSSWREKVTGLREVASHSRRVTRRNPRQRLTLALAPVSRV